MVILYGIKNCDTVKKTTDWLNAHKIKFEFHDYKKSGITKEKLNQWCLQTDWITLLNQKGMTWRNLDAERKDLVKNVNAAIDLMKEKTSIIKRPVIEDENGKIIAIGFNDELYQEVFIDFK